MVVKNIHKYALCMHIVKQNFYTQKLICEARIQCHEKWTVNMFVPLPDTGSNVLMRLKKFNQL